MATSRSSLCIPLRLARDRELPAGCRQRAGAQAWVHATDLDEQARSRILSAWLLCPERLGRATRRGLLRPAATRKQKRVEKTYNEGKLPCKTYHFSRRAFAPAPKISASRIARSISPSSPRTCQPPPPRCLRRAASAAPPSLLVGSTPPMDACRHS